MAATLTVLFPGPTDDLKLTRHSHDIDRLCFAVESAHVELDRQGIPRDIPSGPCWHGTDRWCGSLLEHRIRLLGEKVKATDATTEKAAT